MCAAGTRKLTIAGEKDVTIASADIARQALDLGLADEVSRQPGTGTARPGHPYFTNLTRAPHHFDDPIVIQGKRATQLRYRVRR